MKRLPEFEEVVTIFCALFLLVAVYALVDFISQLP